jgi:16S rRNA (uracil1498-N3)-methyltransferase
VSGFRPRFFIDNDDRAPSVGGSPALGSESSLGLTDSMHALRVLRLRVGDECEVVIGSAVYAASVSRVDERVRVALTERLDGPAAGAVYRSEVGLVQSLGRATLFDQVVGKGTEVGASFFIFLPGGGSSRLSEGARERRLDRWRRIAIEAAKQSKQVSVPRVEMMDSPAQALEYLEARGAESVVLDPAAGVGLVELLGPTVRQGTVMALWIGPENGWRPSDAEWLRTQGVKAARLGRSVLRAETAGPVAVAVTRLSTGDW